MWGDYLGTLADASLHRHPGLGRGAGVVGIGFLGDTTLDALPQPSHLGAGRVAGIELNQPRLHDALAAVLAGHRANRVHRRAPDARRIRVPGVLARSRWANRPTSAQPRFI